MKRVLVFKIFSLLVLLCPLLTYGQYSADRIDEQSVPMSSQGELTVSNTLWKYYSQRMGSGFSENEGRTYG